MTPESGEITMDHSVVVPSGLSASEKRQLDRSFIRGVAWTGGMKWLTQLVTWVSTIVVARLLTPEDYGLVGMATIYLGFVAMLNEFGLGAAIITQRNLDKSQISQLNSLSILLGMSFFALSWVASIPLAAFFGQPQLRWVVIAMSATFVMTAFQTVPSSLLQKDLEFKPLALIETLQVLVQAVCMVLLAWMGMRYWTLVWGGLIGTALSTSLICSRRPHSFSWPRLSAIKAALAFSWYIVVGRITWYFYSNADFMVAGRVLGKSALGAYTFGWNLANLPLQKITALVTRVTPTLFSAVQNDMAAMRQYLLTITEGLALGTFPMAFGMALIAKELVQLALGQKWSGVSAPLQLLAACAAFRSITTLLPHVLVNTGQARFWVLNSLLATVALPLSFYYSSRWGTVGIAAAWIVVHPLTTFPNYWRVFRTTGLSTRDYCRSFWPALHGSMTMALVVLLVRAAVTQKMVLPVRLGVEVASGAAAYILTLYWFHRPRLKAFYQFLRSSQR